ncbi:MAG: polysaccharide deacetylase family protein, partial [Clostridia bacterium]|nr:polysaccharide deacetylase family protein [Clostridia bacterium]
MYPHLYAGLADDVVVPEGKTVYLTFDDGPSDRTDEILEILDRYNIKATFFVMPRKTDACYKRLRAIVEAGHTIGVHTYSHDYS